MTNWTNKPYRPRKMAFTRDDLYRLVVQERKSFSAIGRLYGCDHTAVSYACERMGIKRPVRLSKRDWRDKVIKILGPEAWEAEQARAQKLRAIA